MHKALLLYGVRHYWPKLFYGMKRKAIVTIRNWSGLRKVQRHYPQFQVI